MRISDGGDVMSSGYYRSILVSTIGHERLFLQDSFKANTDDVAVMVVKHQKSESSRGGVLVVSRTGRLAVDHLKL